MRAAKPRARTWLESSSRIARHKASGSCEGTRRVLSRPATISGMPPTAVATTGTPAAMASSNALGEPSDS